MTTQVQVGRDLSVRAAATLLGMRPSDLRRECEAGHIPTAWQRPSGRWVMQEAGLWEWCWRWRGGHHSGAEREGGPDCRL